MRLAIFIMFIVSMAVKAQDSSQININELSEFEALLAIQQEIFKQISKQQLEQFHLARNKQLSEYKLFDENQAMDFKEFKLQMLADKLNFSRQIIKHWPVVETTTNNKVVLYSNDFQQKIVVDYKTKQIRYSNLNGQFNGRQQILNDHQKMLSDIVKLLQQSLQKQPLHYHANDKSIAQLIGLDTREEILAFAKQFLRYNIKQDSELNEKILSDNSLEKQLAISQYNAQEKISRGPASVEVIPPFDFSSYYRQINIDNRASIFQRKPITFSLSLSLNQSDLVAKYQRYTTKWSQKFNLSESWILALIEANSNFSEDAITIAPAYGLMLINLNTTVPVVHENVAGFKASPSIKQLYEPDINIGYGSAYLHVLMTKRYQDIKDKEARLYCALAAYQVGVATVNQIFNGAGSKLTQQAVTKINQLKTQHVLDKLKNGLPQQVDRLFLNNVLAAIKKF